MEKEASSIHLESRGDADICGGRGSVSPKENGERQDGAGEDSKSDRSANGQPDVVDDHPGKSRSNLYSACTRIIIYSYEFFQINILILKILWPGVEVQVLRGL